MKTRLVRFALIALAILLLPLAVTSAKGPFDKVVISGPDLPVALEVTDSERLQALGMIELMDIHHRVDAPAETGPGYELTRYGYHDVRETYVAFDSVIYYPAASDGLPYVYYVGIINGSSEYDRRWYPATAEGDWAMRDILSEAGVAAPGQPLPWTLAEVIARVDHWLGRP